MINLGIFSKENVSFLMVQLNEYDKMVTNVKRTYYIETYGCAANRSDSERILRILQDKDFTQVSSIDDAEITIFNTCGVKDPTERKILKSLRQLETQPNTSTIITGCLPNISLKAIKKANPSFGAIVDTKSTHMIGSVIEDVLAGQRNIELFATSRTEASNKIDILPLNTNPLVGILTINEGCDGNCSFCGTKLARGKTLSHAPDKLLNQASIMLANGAKELWITSQDSGAYKYEQDGKIWELPELISALCELPYRFRLRLGMINPDHVLRLEYGRTENKLFDVIEAHTQIFQFLHIPVQAANYRILELMKRRYSVQDFKKIVQDLWQRFPRMTLSTDIIAGFPTESEDDFMETVDLIKWFKPPIMNLSRYGARPGTVAARMDGQIHERDSKERTRLLMKIWEPLALQGNSKWLNWEGQVLIDEPGKRDDENGAETIVARNYAYKPIILPASDGELGEFASVKIIDTRTHYLVGTRITKPSQLLDELL